MTDKKELKPRIIDLNKEPYIFEVRHVNEKLLSKSFKAKDIRENIEKEEK